MKIIDGKEKEYIRWRGEQSDEYGRKCLFYAEKLADLFECEINRSNESPEDVIRKNASRLSHKANDYEITGIMYDFAGNILARYWKYGELLKDWHNAEYGRGGWYPDWLVQGIFPNINAVEDCAQKEKSDPMKKEKKFTMDQINESRHKGKRIYGVKKGYCDLQECCEHCNKKVRFWCKVIRYIEDYQTKIIKRICD